MHAVVSVFNKKNENIVRSMWKESERTFHIRGVYGTPYPHFSYRIAFEYNIAKWNPNSSNLPRKATLSMYTRAG